MVNTVHSWDSMTKKYYSTELWSLLMFYCLSLFDEVCIIFYVAKVENAYV